MELIDDIIEENEILESVVRPTTIGNLKRRLISLAVSCVLVLVAVLSAWFYGQHIANVKADAKIAELEQRIIDLINEPIVVNPVAPEIILNMLHTEINDIGELATIEYLFTDAAKFSDSNQIFDWEIPFTEKSFTLKWNGTIKAGVNLNLVSVKVIELEKKIIVSLPAAEILSYEIDSESVELLDEKDNIFNNISIDDKVKFDAATEKAMKSRAIENGLLEKAHKNAQDIIKRLLMSNPSIKDGYTIEFVDILQ